MGNYSYINYFIETLTGVMNDAIINNVSLQANSKVIEDIIKEQSKKIEELNYNIENISQSGKEHIDSLNETINNLNIEISRLNNEIDNTSQLRKEYLNIKTQVQHLDTFRKELLKSQSENDILRKQLDQLQNPSSKKKKNDVITSNTKIDMSNNTHTVIVTDAGTF